jgi:hypothetical protein
LLGFRLRFWLIHPLPSGSPVSYVIHEPKSREIDLEFSEFPENGRSPKSFS